VYRELLGTVYNLSLKKDIFVRASGQRLEDACGLAVRINDEVVYLSRAEIRELMSGPIYFGRPWEVDQCFLPTGDPVNDLLCDVGDLRWDERVEADLSSLPIVRVKKGTRTGRPKRKG
jgi:hypothetical protein